MLFLVLFGTIDLGRAFFAYVTVTNASREGARYAMTNLKTAVASGTVSEMEAIIQANTTVESPIVLNASTSTVAVACAPYGSQIFKADECLKAQPGDLIRVTVTYDFQFATLYLFGLTNITLSNYTIMAVIQ